VSALTPWVNGTVPLPALDPTPLFSRGRSLSRLLPGRWPRLRRGPLERADHTCEVCGHHPGAGERPLHVHEGWGYDLADRVQWLDRLWVLCWRCHALAHTRPVSAWPDPPPTRAELDRYAAIASQAHAAAESRRLALFAIDLRQGQEQIAAADAQALTRVDARTLPARIRNVVRYTFDEPLRRAVDASPHSVITARALDRLLVDRTRALAEPEVFAALFTRPAQAEYAHGGRRFERGDVALRCRMRRHTYGQWPQSWADAARWPTCDGCDAVRPIDAHSRNWMWIATDAGVNGFVCPSCWGVARAHQATTEWKTLRSILHTLHQWTKRRST
jgi:hypothetical protein